LARPELDRLRDDASKGAFDAVLINDVDRLARDVSHLGIVQRDFERRGSILRKLPTEISPTHNLRVTILGSFAEFEQRIHTLLAAEISSHPFAASGERTVPFG
jgi:DNA invertase Pin-like site-specific DNA recombinase